MKFKKLSKTARAPTKGSKKAAGWDIYADIRGPIGVITISPGESAKIPTGIAIQPDPGYFSAMYARSGLASKEGLRLINGVAVLDEDYVGEIGVVLYNDSNETRTVQNGQRVAQVVFQPYSTADLI